MSIPREFNNHFSKIIFTCSKKIFFAVRDISYSKVVMLNSPFNYFGVNENIARHAAQDANFFSNFLKELLVKVLSIIILPLGSL